MAQYKQMDDGQTSLPARDPFYVVKEKVQELTTTLSTDFDRWKELLETTNTASHKDFAPLTQSVKVTLKKLNIDLNDLAQTIEIVSANRQRFKDIDDKELDSRKRFVNDTKSTVQEYEDTLGSVRTKSKLERDSREQLYAKENSQRKSAKEREREREGNDFVDAKAQSQQQVERQQDEVLDDMTHALDRLGAMAGTIKTTLGEQNEMLKEFDNEMDRTQGAMGKVMRKIDKLLGQSDSGRLCCIFFLFVIVCVLIIAIIYT